MFENTILFGVIALILALLLSALLAYSRASTQKQVLEATRAAKALSDFNRALIHETSLPVVLERITGALTQNLGFSQARMHLLEGVSREMRAQSGETSTDPERIALMREALFAPPEGMEMPGVIVLPILAATKVGSNARCWFEPETKCKLTPKITKAQRSSTCLSCEHFAAFGVLELEYQGRRHDVASLTDYVRASSLAVSNTRMYQSEQQARQLAEQRLERELELKSENSQLLDSLETERARLDATIEHLSEGIVLLEADKAQANAVARAWLGLPKDFRVQDLPTQLRAKLEPGNSDLVINNTHLQVIISRQDNRTVLVLRDLERFGAIERTKAELLSRVSHELKTPLTSIQGFTSLLISGGAGELTDDQYEFLNTTYNASKNLEQTVQNLMDASKLEAGLFEINCKASRPNFEGVLERFVQRADEQGILMDINLASLPIMDVDAMRLELVLANLLSNALRFTAKNGRITVTTSLEAGSLEVNVTDNGVGMSGYQLAHLFERTSSGLQTVDDGAHNLEGIGLALYVSKAIINAHDGKIQVSSQPGIQTSFQFSVPLEKQVAKPLEPETKAPTLVG
jgi:signal transduction histidine kinase